MQKETYIRRGYMVNSTKEFYSNDDVKNTIKVRDECGNDVKNSKLFCRV